MIYAEDITKYDCTDAELEERILFWVAVAGKNAQVQAHKVDGFITLLRTLSKESDSWTPFELIRATGSDLVRWTAKNVKIGKYNTLVPCYVRLASSTIDLRACSVEDLMKFPGIGPKTARCFILHSRAGARLAGLDRHIMRFLASRGYTRSIGTPGNPREYARLEAIFLKECDKYHMAPADFDLMLWKVGAGRPL